MALKVGSRLGHYDVTALIGEGGMGCLGAQLAISVNNCPPPRDPRSRMTSFKRTQRKYVQKAYRVRNWREYETGLRARGSLTVWLGLTRWQARQLELAEADAQEARPTTPVLEPRHRDDGHLGLGVWPGVQAD